MAPPHCNKSSASFAHLLNDWIGQESGHLTDRIGRKRTAPPPPPPLPRSLNRLKVDSPPPPLPSLLNRLKADSNPPLVKSAESGQRIHGCQMAPPLHYPGPPLPEKLGAPMYVENMITVNKYAHITIVISQ